MMQSYAESRRLSPSRDGVRRGREAGDIAYRGLTIAAMLMVLGSLWLF